MAKIALLMSITCRPFSMWELYSGSCFLLLTLTSPNVFSFVCPQMIDPGGISNWSVTHVDWSERKWHPKSYRAQDVTDELLKNITVHVLLYIFKQSHCNNHLPLNNLQPCLLMDTLKMFGSFLWWWSLAWFVIWGYCGRLGLPIKMNLGSDKFCIIFLQSVDLTVHVTSNEKVYISNTFSHAFTTW